MNTQLSKMKWISIVKKSKNVEQRIIKKNPGIIINRMDLAFHSKSTYERKNSVMSSGQKNVLTMNTILIHTPPPLSLLIPFTFFPRNILKYKTDRRKEEQGIKKTGNAVGCRSIYFGEKKCNIIYHSINLAKKFFVTLGVFQKLRGEKKRAS